MICEHCNGTGRVPDQRACPHCGQTFTTTRGNKVYCTPSCAQAGAFDRWIANPDNRAKRNARNALAMKRWRALHEEHG